MPIIFVLKIKVDIFFFIQILKLNALRDFSIDTDFED